MAQTDLYFWRMILDIQQPFYDPLKVSAEAAHEFGELVADPETNELLHYTEKPETFVSA